LEGKGEKRGYGGEEEQNALRISIYRKMAHWKTQNTLKGRTREGKLREFNTGSRLVLNTLCTFMELSQWSPFTINVCVWWIKKKELSILQITVFEDIVFIMCSVSVWCLSGLVIIFWVNGHNGSFVTLTRLFICRESAGTGKHMLALTQHHSYCGMWREDKHFLRLSGILWLVQGKS
jgi:hypothetical protein